MQRTSGISDSHGNPGDWEIATLARLPRWGTGVGLTGCNPFVKKKMSGGTWDVAWGE